MAASAPSPSPSASPSPPPKKPNNKNLPPPPPLPSVPASWSHLETIQLIDAYQEKWYSLNRGQLKAHQWEEVAASVAARCGSDPPTKTATQCRHKIEKLRKRYRSDKHRPSASTWPYFDRMDLMERGPTDPPRTSATTTDDDDDDEGDDVDHPFGAANNTHSINHILRRPQPPPMLSLLGKSFPCFSRSPRFRKRSSFEEEEEEDPMSKLALVVRSFGEGFVRMEKMKMEMMREVERNRMEMEMKRTEMILKSQQRIADAIADAFGSQKKAKNSNEMSN